jgi:O-antigen/teichoic acid export membrane protein
MSQGLTHIRSFIKSKFEHAGVRRYAANLSWMFFGRLSTMAIGFLATMYIARSLGPLNYGELSYALSFTGLVGIIGSLGIEQLLYRELVMHPERRAASLGTALALRLSLGTLAFIIAFILGYLTAESSVSILAIAIIGTTYITGALNMLSMEFQADAKAKAPTIISIIVVLTMNTLKILVVAMGGGVLYLAATLAVEPILYGGAYIYLHNKHYRKINELRFDPEIAKIILVGAIPLAFVGAFNFISQRIDQIMINHMIDASSVGIYDAAVRLSEVWYFIPAIIAQGMFPAIANAKRVNSELYLKRAQKLALTLLATTILIALPVTVLAKPLVEIVYGAKFLEAPTILSIYVWSNIGAALNLIIQQLLIIEKRHRAIAITTCAGAIVNIGLNFILIPRIGPAGAAWASMISYLVPTLVLITLPETRRFTLRLLGAAQKQPA